MIKQKEVAALGLYITLSNISRLMEDVPEEMLDVDEEKERWLEIYTKIQELGEMIAKRAESELEIEADEVIAP